MSTLLPFVVPVSLNAPKSAKSPSKSKSDLVVVVFLPSKVVGTPNGSKLLLPSFPFVFAVNFSLANGSSSSTSLNENSLKTFSSCVSTFSSVKYEI